MPSVRSVLARCALLALAPSSSAARLTSSVILPGHSLNSFSALSNMTPVLGGGAAWSADGQQVYTLDTTGALKRWDVRTGRLLLERQQKGPGNVKVTGFPPILTLSGWRGDRLRLRAHGDREGQPVVQDFTADPARGTVTLVGDCPSSRLNLRVCLPGGRSAFLQGGRLVRRDGQGDRTVEVPAGLKVGALVLNRGGQVAALAVRPAGKFAGDVDGPATLLLWDGETLNTVSLGDRNMSLQHARLTWTPLGWLYAMSMHDAQGGGIRTEGQMVGLLQPSGERVWDFSPQLGLRGVWPSPDGQQFMTFRQGSVPEVRRMTDGAFVRGLGEAVVDARPLQSGEAVVAVLSGGNTGRIVLSTPAGVKPLSGLKAEHLAVNRDGTRFLSSEKNLIRLHDIRGKVLLSLQVPGFVGALAFRPGDGSFSAAVSREPYGEQSTLAWTLGGKALVLPKNTVFPLSSPILTLTQDQKAPGQSHRERLTAVSGGETLWQSGWRVSYGLRPSVDGRWLAAWSQSPASKRAPVEVDFFRFDTRSGSLSKTLTVKPTTGDGNSAWSLVALSQDGRYALLREGTGDSCGWGLYNFKLADLGTGKAVPTPEGLAQAYRRMGGCGVNLPFVATHFGPGYTLLIQDGNRLDWWQVPLNRGTKER